jgi:hypothetical protein
MTGHDRSSIIAAVCRNCVRKRGQGTSYPHTPACNSHTRGEAIRRRMTQPLASPRMARSVHRKTTVGWALGAASEPDDAESPRAPRSHGRPPRTHTVSLRTLSDKYAWTHTGSFADPLNRAIGNRVHPWEPRPPLANLGTLRGEPLSEIFPPEGSRGLHNGFALSRPGESPLRARGPGPPAKLRGGGGSPGTVG